MVERRRLNVRAILADKDLRRALMVPTIQATQAREGIETTLEQAERAYYVVTEAERAVFFELEPFKGGKKDERDERHEVFVKSLRSEESGVRHDVARRDFSSVEGSPLAYRRLNLLAPLFHSWPSLKSVFGVVQRGAPTAEDERLVRWHWEVQRNGSSANHTWVPFSKGGSFSRFYYDVALRVAWDPTRRTFFDWYGRPGRPIERPESLDNFFIPSVTWPRRTQRGFNVRYVANAVFSDKSGFVQPRKEQDLWFVLGVLNSSLVQFVLDSLVSFGSYEVGAVQRLPIAVDAGELYERLAAASKAIWAAKATWDRGNEVCTAFERPWLVHHANVGGLRDWLDAALNEEADTEKRIRAIYNDLNADVYRLYAIPNAARAEIERSLGERPAEVVWPQMEGKSAEQKRMEHVWRLLSYAVKRVVESDDDGIVPFNRSTGETPLAERVWHELAALFPGRDERQFEVEIVNELKRSVKGYRKCASLDEWLANGYFEYHASLYKNRPIFWHIASAQGATPFGCGALVHYHRFDRNRMAKLRATYVRDTIEELRREAGLADKAGRAEDRIELQARLEEVQAFDRKLQLIQEGHHEGAEGGPQDFRILTPWKKPETRPKGWNPDIDDGVKVNIAPLDRAGVLRISGAAG
jgi:hypothetical protein